DAADLLVGEVLDGVVEDVARGDEVGVEDGDELAGGDLEAGGEGAGLVAFAVGAVDVLDGVALGGPLVDGALGDVGGMVGGVVKDRDLEAVEGVVDVAVARMMRSATVSSLYMGSWMVTLGSWSQVPRGS